MPFYPNTPIDPMDFYARQERLKYQQALIEQLRGMGQQNPGTGQMVSGRFVPTTTGQKLAPAIAGIGSSVMTPMLQGQQDKLNQDMSANADNWMGTRPQPTTVDLPGPQPQESEGIPLTGVRRPTEQENLQWAQQGMRNPLTRALAARYAEDRLVREPERQEAREFRAAEAERARVAQAQLRYDTLAQQLQMHNERLAQAAEAARQRAEDLRYSVDQRREAAEEANRLRAQIAAGQQRLEEASIQLRREIERREAASTKDKAVKTTQDEKASAGYLHRMRESEKLLTELEGDEPNLAQKAVGGIPMVGKTLQPYVMGPNTERVLQAQRDWVRAKLRKESGAVIADEEMAEEIRTYFPQPGEGQQVKDQKRAARKAAERQLEIGSGNALPQVTDPGATSSRVGPGAPGLPSGWSVTVKPGGQ